MVKIQNVIKSNEKVQVNNIVSASVNTGTCVKLGVTSHNQYNNDVWNEWYKIYTKYQKNTTDNLDLFNAIDETLDITWFETIGEEVVICNCIKMHDIFNFYTNGCIQQFYDAFCESHSVSESITLGRFLSAIGIEVWRDVECFGGIYKGLYFVSNLGRVLSLNKNKHFGKIVKPYDNNYGYLLVKLCHEGKNQQITVHRLVALTFYGEPTEKLASSHANTNKYDNRLFNLDFKTYSDNINNPLSKKKYRNTIDNRTTASTATKAE